jgi:ferritin-like metal-binding protein YciE
MVIKNAQELFMQLLSETYSAEKQMTRALPKMARAADDKKLVEGFEHHLEETQGQLERLEQAADSIADVRIKRIKSHAMESLIMEGEELVDATEKGPVRDAGLIAAAQRVEHFEIAGYGTLCELADQLGYNEAKKQLAETLKEEKATDEKLSKMAHQNVNKEAAA